MEKFQKNTGCLQYGTPSKPQRITGGGGGGYGQGGKGSVTIDHEVVGILNRLLKALAKISVRSRTRKSIMPTIGLASATSFSHSNAILVLNNLGVGS